jgi:hypothetical protein
MSDTRLLQHKRGQAVLIKDLSYEVWFPFESTNGDKREAAPIPEDEILDNVYKKLLMREQLIDQGNQLEELLAEDFLYIRQDGEQMNKEAYKSEKELSAAIKDIQITSISQKTKLICYELDGIVHTSIWRRHETWQNIFHQETKKEDKQ